MNFFKDHVVGILIWSVLASFIAALIISIAGHLLQMLAGPSTGTRSALSAVNGTESHPPIQSGLTADGDQSAGTDSELQIGVQTHSADSPKTPRAAPASQHSTSAAPAKPSGPEPVLPKQGGAIFAATRTVSNETLINLRTGEATELSRGGRWDDDANVWFHRREMQQEYLLGGLVGPSDQAVDVLEPTNKTRWFPLRMSSLPSKEDCEKAYPAANIDGSIGYSGYTPRQIKMNNVAFCFITDDGRAGSISVIDSHEGTVQLLFSAW